MVSLSFVCNIGKIQETNCTKSLGHRLKKLCQHQNAVSRVVGYLFKVFTTDPSQMCQTSMKNK